MNRKERKQAKLEVKFKKKEELALAKQNIKKSIAKIKEQIKLAKQKEITLKAEAKQSLIKEKEENANAVVKDRANFFKQRALINENKKYLNSKKRELKEKINLARVHNRQAILEEKAKHRQALIIAKRTKREEMLKHKQMVEELKEQRMQRMIEANQKIADKQDEMQAFKIKQAELIAKKKTEILQQKRKLEAERIDAKHKAQSRRSKEIADIKMEREELKQLALEQKSKLSHLHLKMQEEEVKQENESIKILDKEKEKSVKAIAKAFEATKQATLKQEQMKQESYAIEEEEVEEAKAKIWEAETQVDLEANEWDDSHEEAISLIKGVVVKSIGKDAWKIYEKANKQNTKLRLDKVKLGNKDIELIKEYQELKKENLVTDIREFVKYIAYLTDREENNLLVTNELVAVLVNILQGRTFQFLDGYFSLEKVGSYRLLRYSNRLHTVASNVVSLPDEEFFNKFQEIILRKIKKGLVVKVNENIGIKYEDNTVVVMHDLGFIK